jgi:hypothetical protein
MGIAGSFWGASKNLKTKTFLAAEAQSTQRKSWFFPLRPLRLCGKAFPCVRNHHGSLVFRSFLSILKSRLTAQR